MDAGRLRVEGLRSLPDLQAEKIRQQIRENKTAIIMAIQCGARCKNTGLCYGLAYFEAKPGPHRDCTFKDCPWIEKNNKQTRGLSQGI